ncbi:hypothetical protein [Inquilinus sp. CAU 1745]|uniref:hypothetical protein n=1 Tax=Inquilinus sp. CAU 1745 TaxID=3140369 RepID=UPI00325A4824
MRTSTNSARTHHVIWEPWRDDLLTVIGRGGGVETEPVSWLAPRQTRRVEALIEDLHLYQALASDAPGTADAARARRRQGREIAARLTDLLQVGVKVRWHADSDKSVRLLCQRCRR